MIDRFIVVWPPEATAELSTYPVFIAAQTTPGRFITPARSPATDCPPVL